MRWFRDGRIAAALAVLTLAGCDQAAKLTGNGDEDEKAALANPAFTNPILMQLPADTYAAAQRAAAMNGVDERPTDGAAYNSSDFLPCHVPSPINPGIGFYVSIGTYPFGQDVVMNWLASKGLTSVNRYTIRYPNATSAQYGTENTFICPVVSDAMLQFIPEDQRAGGVHNGVAIPLLRRKFDAWTYRNRYETQIPGMGSVKVFAGTFTYTLESVIPGATPSGSGTASVKAILNPDTGRWQSDSYQGQDPSLTLE
jgi:hypothetical protein